MKPTSKNGNRNAILLEVIDTILFILGMAELLLLGYIFC